MESAIEQLIYQSFDGFYPDKRTGRHSLKKIRVFPKLYERETKQEPDHSKLFVFCEKESGVAQFRAESSADLDCAVERLAGIFAMQCLVHGQNPSDFVVLVPAEHALAQRLMSRANDLLAQGRAVSSPASLSPRQREILEGIMNKLANKEIASHLNISERTVKFHVSSLLTKFRVATRSELARRAAGMLQRPATHLNPGIFERPLENRGERDLNPVAMDRRLRVAGKTRGERISGRALSA
ncbi:MAG: helix-turn-helix domain-containing protein [Candidatus Dormibacteria bacterium]